jgi:AcrR family transcriptional regulator
MAARAHSVDPRAERVRARLRDAALALAHERPVDEITVSDLVQRAEVSRQVFYQHFGDRDDAVTTAITAAFAAATADLGADPAQRILRLFDFAADHRAMYRNIFPSAVSQRAAVAFRDELTPACRQIAADGMAVVSGVTSVTAQSVERFLVGGFMEVLRSWMEDPTVPDVAGGPAEPDVAGKADLRGRVGGALDTVNVLLGLTDRALFPTT